MFQVPQTSGHPGWIIFTYEDSKPVCLWVSAVECKKVHCIIDERLCGDTFLKVEKIGDLEFAVSDIWVYNSNCVFACSTFKQRYDWLSKLLTKFTRCIEGVTIDLIHKSDLADVEIRGYEYHPQDMPGCHGYFVQNDGTEILDIIRLSMPDCYEIVGRGYLRVPDLKTSVFLRTKGISFKCRCKKYDDEFWDVAENIPDVNVNA
jgi:hypothetical protein